MSELGNWERTGPKELLVDKQSAVQDDSNPQDCFPINENHSDMVKFSDGSPEYDAVITFLHSILPSVALDSSAVLEDEPFKAGGNKSSSKSRKWKADNVRENKISGLNADSLRAFTSATFSCFKTNPLKQQANPDYMHSQIPKNITDKNVGRMPQKPRYHHVKRPRNVEARKRRRSSKVFKPVREK
jgi:hypothetical protein